MIISFTLLLTCYFLYIIYLLSFQAREAVETRAQVEKQLASKKKEDRESKLRLLAQQARDERAGIKTAGGKSIHLCVSKSLCKSLHLCLYESQRVC